MAKKSVDGKDFVSQTKGSMRISVRVCEPVAKMIREDMATAKAEGRKFRVSHKVNFGLGFGYGISEMQIRPHLRGLDDEDDK